MSALSSSSRRKTRELEARLGLVAVPIKSKSSTGRGSSPQRERGALADTKPFRKIGCWLAYDEYDEQAPGAAHHGCCCGGRPRGGGRCQRRDGQSWFVVAGDDQEDLRAQKWRCAAAFRLYMVDLPARNPYQGGVFPGQYGAAANLTTIHHAAVSRIPQLAAVMGRVLRVGGVPPSVERVISWKGLVVHGVWVARISLKAQPGRRLRETLGAPSRTRKFRGCAHTHSTDDTSCNKKLRELVARYLVPCIDRRIEFKAPSIEPAKLYDMLPAIIACRTPASAAARCAGWCELANFRRISQKK